MKCKRAQELLTKETHWWEQQWCRMHLWRCKDCRSNLQQMCELDRALYALGRKTPAEDLLLKLLTTANDLPVTDVIKKGRFNMKRAALVFTCILVMGVVATGLFNRHASPSGTDLLISAAAAMETSDTVHLRGETNAADEYTLWNPGGKYECWISSQGFRFDFFDQKGELVRAIGGTSDNGKVWQYFPRLGESVGENMDSITNKKATAPPVTPGVIFNYHVGRKALVKYIKVTRTRVIDGQLRIAGIRERGHTLTDARGFFQGKAVTVVNEDLGVTMVNAWPKGFIEYYLDNDSGRFLGLTQFGPDKDGHKVVARVDLVEYGADLPTNTFACIAPSGAAQKKGKCIKRASGDIVFSPAPDYRTEALIGIAYEIRHYACMGSVPWSKAEAAYKAVLQDAPENYEAREYLGRMYTRWGRYKEALAILPEGKIGWTGLNRAFCLDALGRRQEALEIYQLLQGWEGTSIGEWAKLGMQQPTWPKDIDISAEPNEVRLLPDSQWQATAYHWSHPFTPQAAIDNNRIICWASGGALNGVDGQEPGNWFEVDFGSQLYLTRVVLDHYGEQTFYTNNWPRGVKAMFSEDGTTWQEVAISQAGPGKLATIRFTEPQHVRKLRFEITKEHHPEWWSIHELYVFAPKD
jgi:hypothetical protein